MSLVYQEVFAELVVSLISCSKKFKKIIMVGDEGQLPPLRTGNLFLSLIDSLKKMNCVVEFEHNHRVKEGSDLIKRNQLQIKKGNGTGIRFDTKNCVHVPIEYYFLMPFSEKINNFAREIIKTIETHNIGEYEHHLITTTNKVRRALGNLVEKFYHDKQYNSKQQTVDYSYYGLWVDRKVMFKNNCYDRDAITNEIMVLREIYDMGTGGKSTRKILCTSEQISPGTKRYIVCEVIDGRKKQKIFLFDDWVREWLKKATVTTIDSFQGRQQKKIIGGVLYSSDFLTQQRLYTLWTRPEESIFYIGSRDSFERACRNPEPIRRSVLSEDILLNCKENAKTIFEIC